MYLFSLKKAQKYLFSRWDQLLSSEPLEGFSILQQQQFPLTSSVNINETRKKNWIFLRVLSAEASFSDFFPYLSIEKKSLKVYLVADTKTPLCVNRLLWSDNNIDDRRKTSTFLKILKTSMRLNTYFGSEHRKYKSVKSVAKTLDNNMES